MGSLKSPRMTFASIETIALNCSVFEKIAFFLYFGITQTNKQTDEHMDSIDALSHSRERQLNK